MMKIKKLFSCFLSAAIILSCTAVTTMNSCAESIVVSENTVSSVPCMLYFEHTDYLVQFCYQYEKDLIDSGMNPEEAKTIRSELYYEYHDNGRLLDDEIDKKRIEFETEKENKKVEEILSVLKVNKEDITVSRDKYNLSGDLVYGTIIVKIETELSEDQIQIKNENENLSSVILLVGDEKEKYGTKIIFSSFLDLLREQPEHINLGLTVSKEDVEMSESEFNNFLIDNYDLTDISISSTTFTYSVKAVATLEAIEKLCQSDFVKKIYSSNPNPVPTANPTVSPTFTPSQSPADSKNQKGDINSDGKTDLTDLSELSLALVGDKELTEAQQKAADVDGDGAVKLADLAKFRQYLSKVISSLG